jgi:RNA polymerase sigma-70 factor (ECF subfamily)
MERSQLAAAVELILNIYGPELRGYLRCTLGDPADGDDVFQDVTIAIWERLPTFRFASSLRTWCYAIAHRQVLKRLDRYSRRHRVQLDTDQQENLRSSSQTSLRDNQQRTEAVAAAAAQLSPSEREVIILRSERNLSFGDIKRVMGLSSEVSARQRFHRARDRLKLLVVASLKDSIE